MARKERASRVAFRFNVEQPRRSHYPSIRHVPTVWARESGRRLHPTFYETTDVGRVSPFPDVEQVVDARRFLRYTDYLTRSR